MHYPIGGYIIGHDLYKSRSSFDEIYELIVDDGTAIMETSRPASEFEILADYVHKYVDFSFATDRGAVLCQKSGTLC